MEPNHLKQTLKELITDCLQASYVSVSSQDGIKTGNRYQSIKFGTDQTAGFRSDRTIFLDQIKFSGKKVLDLGSNLGELSRDARSRGAWLVDGFEYDARFIETAQLVNAYNDVTRVSFFQRDITDRSIYDERYDIVLAFSVFTYLKHVIDKLADITDQVLILETHKLDGNLDSTYLDPISKHFPYHQLLGESDWGARLDDNMKRAVIAFAKDEHTLAEGLIGLERPMRPSSDAAVASVTTSRSTNANAWHVEVASTQFYDTFFSSITFSSVEELLSILAARNIDLDVLWESGELKKMVSGWAYWWVYIKGYLEYMNFGTIEEDNVYARFMSRYYLPNQYDPGLSQQLDTPDKAIERIRLRFSDFDRFRANAGRENEVVDALLPLTIAFGVHKPDSPRKVVLLGLDAPPFASLINGFHRLFLARLFGVEYFRCRLLEAGRLSLDRPKATKDEPVMNSNQDVEGTAVFSAVACQPDPGDSAPNSDGVAPTSVAQPESVTGFYGRFWDSYIQKTWPRRAALRGGALEWPGDEWGQPEGWERLFEELIVPAGVEGWERAVEIGPGSGKYTSMVLESSQANISAYDVSPKFLDVCAQRCSEWVAQERLSLHPLNLQPSQMLTELESKGWRRRIDAFYSIDAMVHVDLQYLIVYLVTAALTLKPGGKLVMTLADVTGDKGFAKLMSNIAWAYPAQANSMGSAKFEWLSPDIVRSLLPRLGFEIDVLFGAPRRDILLIASLADPETADGLRQYLAP